MLVGRRTVRDNTIRTQLIAKPTAAVIILLSAMHVRTHWFSHPAPSG